MCRRDDFPPYVLPVEMARKVVTGRLIDAWRVRRQHEAGEHEDCNRRTCTWWQDAGPLPDEPCDREHGCDWTCWAGMTDEWTGETSWVRSVSVGLIDGEAYCMCEHHVGTPIAQRPTFVARDQRERLTAAGYTEREIDEALS